MQRHTGKADAQVLNNASAHRATQPGAAGCLSDLTLLDFWSYPARLNIEGLGQGTFDHWFSDVRPKEHINDSSRKRCNKTLCTADAA